MKSYEGNFETATARFGLVTTRFNDFITERLLDGATDTLVRHGAASENLEVVRVPGAYELPLAVKVMAESGRYDAVIVLGCVIRGSTAHFDYVAGECSKGVHQVMMQHSLPIGFGLLTTDTIEQAIERAGTKAGNKGADAALAALEMVNLIKSFPSN